jgi:hypothetical protein
MLQLIIIFVLILRIALPFRLPGLAFPLLFFSVTFVAISHFYYPQAQIFIFGTFYFLFLLLLLFYYPQVNSLAKL